MCRQASCDRGTVSPSKTKDLIKRVRRFAKPFQIADGEVFPLKDVGPGDTLDFDSAGTPSAKEILVVRVHPEFLEKQNLPPKRLTEDIWKERYKDSRASDRHVTAPSKGVAKARRAVLAGN